MLINNRKSSANGTQLCQAKYYKSSFRILCKRITHVDSIDHSWYLKFKFIFKLPCKTEVVNAAEAVSIDQKL